MFIKDWVYAQNKQLCIIYFYLFLRVDYSVAEGEQLQLASWAPVGTGLVYVLNNNIYYISAPENVLNPEKITSDGVGGVIYNGVPDWVYEGLFLQIENDFQNKRKCIARSRSPLHTFYIKLQKCKIAKIKLLFHKRNSQLTNAFRKIVTYSYWTKKNTAVPNEFSKIIFKPSER